MRRLIILAAGCGTRLGPLTQNCPKCMVEIEGRPLLEWQIESARAAGTEEIIVVRGYHSNQIQFRGIKYVENQEFASTNMVYSLWCAREYFGSEFVLSYGDILFNVEVLQAMYQTLHPISVAIDRQWLSYWQQRFDDVFSDAETLKLDTGGRIIDIGQKASSLAEIGGQYIGLVGFRNAAVKILWDVLSAEEESFREGKNKLNRFRSFAQLYMTDLLQGLIKLGYSVNPVFIDGGWFEIDSSKDLNLVSKFIRKEGQRLVIER